MFPRKKSACGASIPSPGHHLKEENEAKKKKGERERKESNQSGSACTSMSRFQSTGSTEKKTSSGTTSYFLWLQKTLIDYTNSGSCFR